MYLAFSEIPETLDGELRSLPSFETSYVTSTGDVMYVFALSEEVQKSVVQPFLEGKYSTVDKTYVDAHFPNLPAHRLYGNRLVFDKSERLRKMWEEKIGVTLADDAEVWPAPRKKDEVYGYLNESGTELPQLAV